MYTEFLNSISPTPPEKISEGLTTQKYKAGNTLYRFYTKDRIAYYNAERITLETLGGQSISCTDYTITFPKIIAAEQRTTFAYIAIPWYQKLKLNIQPQTIWNCMRHYNLPTPKLPLHSEIIAQQLANAQLLIEDESTMQIIESFAENFVYPPTRTLIHGDFHADNILQTTSSVAIIDWEYAALGEPLFDLAYYIVVTAQPFTVEHTTKILPLLKRITKNIGCKTTEQATLQKFAQLALILNLIWAQQVNQPQTRKYQQALQEFSKF